MYRQVCWPACGSFRVSCRRRKPLRWNRRRRCVLTSAGYWEPMWPTASSMWERWAWCLPLIYHKLSYAHNVVVRRCNHLLMHLWLAVGRWFTSSPTSTRRTWFTVCVWRTLTYTHTLKMRSGSPDLLCRKRLCPQEWKRFLYLITLCVCVWSPAA